MLVNLLATEVILHVACRGFPSGAKIYNLVPQIADAQRRNASIIGHRNSLHCIVHGEMEEKSTKGIFSAGLDRSLSESSIARL